MMSTKPEKPDPKVIWGAQAVEPTLLTVQIPDAEKFHSAVRHRNRVEYTALISVVAVFAAQIWAVSFPLLRLGSVLIIAAAIFVMVWIRFRASATPIPSHISFIDYMSRYREELRRQQSALRTVWLWYLAPWVPGLGLFLIGLARVLEHATGNRSPLWLIALLTVVVVGAFAARWLVNLRSARKLQHQIDELSELINYRPDNLAPSDDLLGTTD
jgi:hypothetical protein